MYDIIIIGGGPGGVAAGVYAARKQMKSLLITENFLSQSTVSASIENWIGTVTIPGYEFAQTLEKHLRAQEGIEIRTEDRVAKIEEIAGGPARHTGSAVGGYAVTTTKGERYETKAAIIAAGGRHRHLEVPGEEKFVGKGVVFCSTCDAPFFRGKRTVVVGSGNSALEAVEDLLPYASEIVLLVRSGELKGDQVTRDRIMNDPRVKTVFFGTTQEILVGDKVEGLRYLDTQADEEKVIETDGVFVEIGMVPNTEFVRGLVELNERGEIVLDHRTKSTSKPGMFAGVHLAGVGHDGDVDVGVEVEVLERVGEGAVPVADAVAGLEGGEGGLLLGREGAQDGAHDAGAAVADLAVEAVEVGGVGDDGGGVEAGGAAGAVAVELAAEGLEQRVALVGELVDLADLDLGAGDELGDLVGGQEVEDVEGDDGDEVGVVTELGGVVVAQVLEAGVVGDLARGQEGLCADAAGEEGQAVEGDGVALRLVRDRLRDRVRVGAGDHRHPGGAGEEERAARDREREGHVQWPRRLVGRDVELRGHGRGIRVRDRGSHERADGDGLRSVPRRRCQRDRKSVV
jgi:alkyl hydroperoxide reductase subunit F